MTDIYEETTLKFFSVLSSASGLDPTNKKRNIDGLNVKKYLLKETQVALSKALLFYKKRSYFIKNYVDDS